MASLTGRGVNDLSRLTLGQGTKLPKLDMSNPGVQSLKGSIKLPGQASDDLARKQLGLTDPRKSPDATRGTADRGMVTQTSAQPSGQFVTPRPQPQSAPAMPLAVATGQQVSPQQPQITTPQPQPTPQPQADPRRQALEAYTQSLQKTPEEIQAEEALAQAQESAARGQLKIRGQAIPQDLLIGQSALLASQAELGQQTLEQRLARAQAERQLQAQGAQARLQFEQSQTGSTNEPIKVGDSLVQFNPETGTYQTVFSAGGAGGGAGGTGEVYTLGANPTVDAYVSQVQQKMLNLENVPQGIRDLVAQGLAARPSAESPQAKRAVDQADVALRSIDDVLNNPAVDFPAIRRVAGSAIPGGAEADLINQIQTIKALIGFDALQKMREASPTGGALGQVSERELGFLQSVAGSLNINQSSAQLKKNLQEIQKSFQTLKLINSPDGTPFEIEGTTYIKQGDQLLPQDFSGVGGDTKQASGNLPQRNNNPGNVKVGGLADQFAIGTDNQGHLIFPTPEAGFQALQADLQAKIQGNSRVVKANPTIAELGKVYAEDPNWANSVARILGVDKNTRTANVDFSKLVQAIARQEGFYA